jgi:hypothetical protein
MANIELKLTQAAFDGTLLNPTSPAEGDLLANLGIMMVDAAAGVQDDSGDVSSFVLANGKLRLDFPDQSYDEFTGVTVADPNARKGTGTATGAKLFIPREGMSEQSGLYRFDYDMTGAVPTATRISSLTQSITVTSLLPESSSWYDPILGNGSLSARGAITVDAAGRLGGSIDSLSMTADKLLLSASIQGSFRLSGVVRDIVEGDSELGVSGLLNSLDLQFRDGSLVRMSGVEVLVDELSLAGSVAMPGTGVLAGNDSIRVELPARIGQAFTVASGDGDDSIVLGGGGGLLHADAGGGRDTITLLSDHHHVDGSAGLDTVVFQGARGDYTIRKNGLIREVVNASGADQLGNVERLQFGKSMVAFDVDGTAGQAYRIYQAAFDRKPDVGGLGAWIHVLDHGTSLETVAGGFLASGEFAERYGSNLTNDQFVTRLYQNVLHREPEKGGYDHWMLVLGNGLSRAVVLAAFGESTENKAQVIGAIQDGMEYTLFGA